ncbi:polyamine aminopropyltransferase [Catenovulum sp. 2E275]|uniref:polyamine aminopropyltransferase n=1 Tax=Catenovulum sp. 2E275 TaxID=2980497 RepID=UPI0021CDED2E|nr:polyamine aminopropyltransferase [Catenovulum sp. 2E275]MCU4675896.1 polyamine aminopropyltransferase [Catenovulum sp. 2E275]
MSDLSSPNWFTEQCDSTGSAFSLRIKKKVVEKQSPFQKIEIYETTDFGHLMVIDGCTMVTTRENFLYHEMMSHPALFTHPNPKNVVIIGGGDCGTLREVLKHDSVESVHQIDIDELVTQMALKYFPELCESNSDPRAHVMFDDGIKFMREAEAESLDIVIVDSTDPIGPGEGLFNHAFYTSCLNALRPGGILVQQSESPILHQKLMKEMRDAMLDVGFDAVQTIPFPQPIYPSGFWSCTLARKQGQFGEFRVEDAQAFADKADYYNASIHQAGMQLPNFLKKVL